MTGLEPEHPLFPQVEAVVGGTAGRARVVVTGVSHPATGDIDRRRRSTRRGRRIVAWVLASIGALIVLAVVGIVLLWARSA